MPKLNQILAIEKGTKNRVNDALTAFYHECQKPPLFSGLSRTYRPKDEEGDRLPPESLLVQIKGKERLEDAKGEISELLNVTAWRDWANCDAKADVKVDEKVIIKDAPVTYLLWLEKQITDLYTSVKKLPVLDPTEQWEWSDATGTYVTKPTETVRTKKIPRNHVKADATKEHPAQVDVYTEDVLVGTWSTVKMSGAFPRKELDAMLARIETLGNAVKFAREEANSTEVKTVLKPGDAVVSYVFG